MHKFCCIGITILFLYALPAKAEQRLLEDVIEEVGTHFDARQHHTSKWKNNSPRP